MQSDNFDQFSITRLWLLVRREVIMMTFLDYSMLFIIPWLSTILLLILNYDVKKLTHPYLFIFLISPTIIYIFFIVCFRLGTQAAEISRTISTFFTGRQLPVRITEKIIAEFTYFSILLPFAMLIPLFLPFLIFRLDFYIWLSAVEIFFTVCSPIIAFVFFRQSASENKTPRKYHDEVMLSIKGIMEGFLIFCWSIFSPSVILTKDTNIIAVVATVGTVILWWTTYRISSKNAKR